MSCHFAYEVWTLTTNQHFIPAAAPSEENERVLAQIFMHSQLPVALALQHQCLVKKLQRLLIVQHHASMKQYAFLLVTRDTIKIESALYTSSSAVHCCLDVCSRVI